MNRDDLRELGRIAHRVRCMSYWTKDGLEREGELVQLANRIVATIRRLYQDRKEHDKTAARLIAILDSAIYREQVTERRDVNAAGQRYMIDPGRRFDQGFE